MSSLRNLRILFSTMAIPLLRRVGGSSGSPCYSSGASSYRHGMMIRQITTTTSSSACSKQVGEMVRRSQIRFSRLPSSIVPSTGVSSNWTGRCNFHSSATLQDSFKVQDEEDFNQRVLKSTKPVVVQFHASWCAPCKQLGPRLEKSVALTKDAVDLAVIDIDDNPDIAMSYSVGAVPAVMAIKDGKVVDKFIGLKDEDQVDTFIQNLTK